MTEELKDIALLEIDKFLNRFTILMSRLENVNLTMLKQGCDDLPIRAIQVKESDTHVREGLSIWKFPGTVVDLILDFTFAPTEGVVVWQSSAMTALFKADSTGYPPHAFERRGAKSNAEDLIRYQKETYAKHRPEVDEEQLSESEKFAAEINNTIMDELDCLDPALVTYQQDWEWLALFTTYLFDGDAVGFVWLTPVVSFSENSPHDHLLEIGHRCEVPPEKTRELAMFLHTQVVNMDLRNNTILMENIDSEEMDVAR